MNEVLLQTIVEKLEALEIALLKQPNASKDGEASNELAMAVQSFQSEFMKFTTEFRTNNDCVNNLSKEINTLRLNFFSPKQNQVKHIHHFHKLVWITVSLFLISLLLAYGWMNCHREKKVFEANDIKSELLTSSPKKSFFRKLIMRLI